MFPKNSGFSPKSSTLIGFSIINHPFWVSPFFGNTHIGHVFQIFFGYPGTKKVDINERIPFIKQVLFDMFLGVCSIPTNPITETENGNGT